MNVKLFILLLLCWIWKIESVKNVFDLNLDALDDVYHRAAVTALLKARSRELLKSTPISDPERILFDQCANAAKTPVSLAKCVVQLLNRQKSPIFSFQMDSPSPIEKLVQLFWQTKSFFGSSLPKTNPSTPNQENGQILRKSTIKMRKNPAKFSMEKFYKTRQPIQQIARPKFEFHRLNVQKLKKWSFGEKYGIPEFEKRRRRKVDNGFEAISNLKKIEKYYKQMNHVERFLKKTNDENSQFLNSASKIPMKFKLKKNKDLEIIENVFQTLDSVLGKSKDRFSFFSPQILPILPGVGKGKKHLFSPTLFSFHEKDGLFSLPNVFKSLKMNDNDEKEWLETTLMLTGASKTLEQVVRKLEPQIKDMEEKIYPAIRDLEKIDKNWRRVKRSYTKEQQMDIKKHGYAFLEPEQLELLYNNKYGRKLDLNIEEYKKLDKEGRKQRIDDDIRKLAEIDEDKMAQQISRTKRQSHGASEPSGHGNETEHHHGLITMQPWAFSTKVGEGAALEAVTLSPHAFIADIISPEALSIHTLSPRAFIAAILSPDALVSRVLSPAAFRSEVLSPRALTSFILTPEALLAEVLAPKLLEARVLSPEALIVEVLSPSLIVPRIMSDELGAVLVLSPSVLSPNILSRHVLTVEVLSPHILGGDHEHEEGEHEEGEHEEEHEEGHEEGEHSESHGPEGQHSEDHAHEVHANVAEHGEAVHGATHETVHENVFEGQGEIASATAEEANRQENIAKPTVQSSFHEPPKSITNGVEHRRGVIQKIPKQPIALREGFIEQEPPVFSENFETNQQFFQNKAEVSPKEIPTSKTVQIERGQFEQRTPPLLIHKTVQKVIQLNNKFDPDTFGENADQSERNYQIERPMVTDSWQGQSQISRFHGFGNDHRLSNHAEGHVEEIDLGPVQIGDTRIEKQSISKNNSFNNWFRFKS